MNKYLPLLIVGAVTGLVSAILIVAAVTFKDNTQTKAIRNLSDKVLIKRLLSYAKAHGKSFLAVAFLIRRIYRIRRMFAFDSSLHRRHNKERF